jgi:urease accessory protein
MNKSSGSKIIGALALLLSTTLAQAHPGHANNFGILSGLNHPLTGLDHILAMVAVGLWAAQLGGRALWLVPGTFVSLMALGGVMGWSGVPLPFVEAGIMASIVVLGLLIGTAAKWPLPLSAALVGLFALFHGHAHGAEMPANSGIWYGVGFILATSLLHLAGIGLGAMAKKHARPITIRLAGAAIVAAGLCLVVAGF